MEGTHGEDPLYRAVEQPCIQINVVRRLCTITFNARIRALALVLDLLRPRTVKPARKPRLAPHTRFSLE